MLSSSHWKKRLNPVIVFDFDGVLSESYTHPELVINNQIIPILQTLELDYILCVASKNPRAKLALENMGLSKYFTEIRCGCNFTWGGKYNHEWRISQMTKVGMIQDMLLSLSLKSDHIVYCFDDEKENVDEINKVQTYSAWLIDSKLGLRWEDLESQ